MNKHHDVAALPFAGIVATIRKIATLTYTKSRTKALDGESVDTGTVAK